MKMTGTRAACDYIGGVTIQEVTVGEVDCISISDRQRKLISHVRIKPAIHAYTNCT